MFFRRDKLGREIDLLLEENQSRKAIEIKAGQTFSGSFFSSLDYYGALDIQCPPENRFIVYGGEESQKRSNARVLSWENLADIPEHFF